MRTRSSARWCLPFFALFLASCATAEADQGPPPTIASLSVDGAYAVMTYTDIPDVPEFGDATVYYPVDTAMPIGGVAISPGWTELQRHIEWWGPRLASHGYAVLILDTNDARADQPEQRAEALIAANNYPAEIQAAIPFTPWQPAGDFSQVVAPTLVMAGSADRVASVSDHAWPHYQSIPESTIKVFLEIDGGSHFIADTSRGEDLGTIGRYGIAWLKLYLDGDERYRGFIYGDEAASDSEKFSRYVTSP